MRKASIHQFKLAALLLGALSCGLSGSALAQTQKAAVKAAPAAVATSAAAATAAAASRAEPKALDSIVVIVNDDVITRQELIARSKSVMRRMTAQNVQMPEPADLQRQLLDRMIIERAQLQLAKEQGVRVDDAILDRAIARIAEQQKLSVQEMRNQLEKEGTAFASFREEIREEIIMQRLREREVDGKIQISDAEVDSFMEAEKNTVRSLVELNLAQILIRIPENSSAEQIAAIQGRAENVMRQLRTGADFAKMAGTFSDASDALSGGEVGWRSLDRLPPVFAEALQKLKPGQITPLIKSPGGFHVLKLIAQRSGADNAVAATVEQTRARHILINLTPTVSAADARRRLSELRERLTNKASTFEELARLYSNDGSASKGGDLGWLFPGDTLPEFESAMGRLKVGEVSEPVQTGFGFHLIEVLERKSDDVSKEKKRNAARQVIRERKLEEATEDWQRQVRDRAYVEFRNDSAQ
jgi:peptidyl-prolyl cis-trans isomerase SurA